jgi:hypothetical protein
MSFKDNIENLSDNEIISLALQMILDNLESSNYSDRTKWEMKLRINRMLAGCHYDPNPEAESLDYNIYKLGLTLLLRSNHSSNTKSRAEHDIFPKYLK